MKPPTPVESRFWPKVNKNGPILVEALGPCWLWTGATVPRGYGKILVEGRRLEYAHRLSLAWKLERPLLPGMESAHQCDNPPCVNPDHLFESTTQQNADDMVKKGRQLHGERASKILQTRYQTPGQLEFHSASMKAYFKNTPGAVEKNRDSQGGFPVLCLNNGVVYASQMEAARQLGIKQGGISLVLSGKRPAHRGFRFTRAPEAPASPAGKFLEN